nr:unnamed protein product [Digitaria exilis]
MEGGDFTAADVAAASSGTTRLPRGPPIIRRVQRKKLLILDLNVFKRPHCDDFLRFCIRNFELAIWSSRFKANTDAVVDILMKDLKSHLLFCWELKKLWNKEASGLPWQQGEFSPSNTLLVDDSPYKALRNPPHTAIFPYSYSYKNMKDDSLGPGGDLRLYLEELAGADNIQRFVEEHPFGQLPITERNPNWTFYAQIRDEMGRRKA